MYCGYFFIVCVIIFIRKNLKFIKNNFTEKINISSIDLYEILLKIFYCTSKINKDFFM